MDTPEHLFIHNATIQRYTISTINGKSNYTDGPKFSVQCRIQVLSGEQAVRQGGDRNKYYAKLYTYPDTDIRNEDWVIYKGNKWHISSIRNADDMNVMLTVDMDRPIVQRGESN